MSDLIFTSMGDQKRPAGASRPTSKEPALRYGESEFKPCRPDAGPPTLSFPNSGTMNEAGWAQIEDQFKIEYMQAAHQCEQKFIKQNGPVDRFSGVFPSAEKVEAAAEKYARDETDRLIEQSLRGRR